MASSGPNSPGTLANDATVGTVAWTNPGNAAASDNVYATAAITGPDFTNYLKATNFGFTIPTGVTINGITVDTEMKRDAVDIRNVYAKIVKGGVIGTTNLASNNVTDIQTTDTYKTYGSSANLWGLTWTAADINASNFGFVISSQSQNGSSGSVYIDHIRISVTYTLNAPTVTTQAVSSITQTTATGNGNVTSDGGDTITERGICWDTAINPTTANAKATSSGTTGAFTANLTGLTTGTLYHARAYAINSTGTSYGPDVTFTTSLASPFPSFRRV